MRPPRPESAAPKDAVADAASPEPGYKVGFKRPPLHTRFKPGNRANPKGRPKQSRSFLALLDEALDAKVAARIGGKQVTMTARQAAAKQLAAKIVAGDKTALALWLRYESLRQGPAEAPVADAALSDDEAASVEAYLCRLSGSADEGEPS